MNRSEKMFIGVPACGKITKVVEISREIKDEKIVF